jgi:hypothetical protein
MVLVIVYLLIEKEHFVDGYTESYTKTSFFLYTNVYSQIQVYQNETFVNETICKNYTVIHLNSSIATYNYSVSKCEMEKKTLVIKINSSVDGQHTFPFFSLLNKSSNLTSYSIFNQVDNVYQFGEYQYIVYVSELVNRTDNSAKLITHSIVPLVISPANENQTVLVIHLNDRYIYSRDYRKRTIEIFEQLTLVVVALVVLVIKIFVFVIKVCKKQKKD